MNKVLAILPLSLLMAGCGLADKSITCGNPSGVTVVMDLLGEAAQERALGQLPDQGATIRAAGTKVQLNLSAFRTDKQDPGSTKVFCAAQLNVRLAPETVTGLDNTAKGISTVRSLDDLAASHGFVRNANVFVRQDFKYSLQPTDDHSMIFAESTDQQAAGLMSDLILLDIVSGVARAKAKVDAPSELARIQAEKEQLEEQQAQMNRQAALEAHLSQQERDRALVATNDTTATVGPGFECQKATEQAERLVCSSAELSALDAQLNQRFKDLLEISASPTGLRSSQAYWITKHRNACGDVDCLRAIYQARLRQLNEFVDAPPAREVHPLLAAIPDPLPAHYDANTAYVNAPSDGFLSLRTHPSVTQGERLEKIPHGQPVSVFSCPDSTQDLVDGYSGMWCIVEYGGVRGFVFEHYLHFE